MTFKQFNSRNNALWPCIISVMTAFVSVFMMYCALTSAFSRHDYLAVACGFFYALLFAWVSWMLAGTALYLHKKHKNAQEKTQ